ncbi:hypothetical protein PDB2_02568 [Pseudomonas aeruginosa]
MILLPLTKHCGAIARILVAIEDAQDWEGSYDWLLVAASVMSVEIDTIQHNSNYGWCSPADEFDEARQILLKQFISDLTVFNFAWGALESTLDVIRPQPHPDKSKRGKIGDACHFLQQAFYMRGHVLGLKEEIELFRNLAKQCIGYDSVERRFRRAAALGVSGTGLYTVYELRNLFAHGSLSFPSPDEENRPISEYSSMVTHATRIVLLQLQMLLLAHFGESEEPITISDGPLSLWSTRATLGQALRSCHLEIIEDPRQMTFPEFSMHDH